MQAERLIASATGEWGLEGDIQAVDPLGMDYLAIVVGQARGYAMPLWREYMSACPTVVGEITEFVGTKLEGSTAVYSDWWHAAFLRVIEPIRSRRATTHSDLKGTERSVIAAAEKDSTQS